MHLQHPTTDRTRSSLVPQTTALSPEVARAPGTGSPPALAGTDRDREVFEAVVDVLERAAEDEHVAAQVGRIDEVVRLRSAALPDDGVVLVARGGLEVFDDAPAGETVTIDLALSTADLLLLSEGRLRMPMAIAGGRATYSGPVRHFLRVVPIVQAMVCPPVPMGTNAAQDEER